MGDPTRYKPSSVGWFQQAPQLTNMSDHELGNAKVHTTHEKPVSIWRDMIINRRAYWMAMSACWGGMLFGWDTGLIGGIVSQSCLVFLTLP